MARNVVTMIGELADTFTSRREGMNSLVHMAARQLAHGDVLLYAEASNHVTDFASANWHASALLVGRLQGAALSVDLGLTTADIVPVASGAVAARAYPDGLRFHHGERRSCFPAAGGRS